MDIKDNNKIYEVDDILFSCTRIFNEELNFYSDFKFGRYIIDKITYDDENRQYFLIRDIDNNTYKYISCKVIENTFYSNINEAIKGYFDKNHHQRSLVHPLDMYKSFKGFISLEQLTSHLEFFKNENINEIKNQILIKEKKMVKLQKQLDHLYKIKEYYNN